MIFHDCHPNFNAFLDFLVLKFSNDPYSCDQRALTNGRFWIYCYSIVELIRIVPTQYLEDDALENVRERSIRCQPQKHSTDTGNNKTYQLQIQESH